MFQVGIMIAHGVNRTRNHSLSDTICYGDTTNNRFSVVDVSYQDIHIDGYFNCKKYQLL